ncbi:MAG TPA: nuclear transport factor 2 family protein [Acidobacteriaceae bacterium]|nr:nuclear transport factor 2 family protein [Acidobacteriaceae bacterium]
MPRSPLEVTGAFVAAINAMDLPALRFLMTNDHVFTDARGTVYAGADKMIDGWQQFFYAYPKYWISIDSNFQSGSRVALFGTVGGKWRVNGTVVPGSWQANAAFLAEVDRDRIRRWSIFCDTSWVSPPVQPEYPVPSIVEV